MRCVAKPRRSLLWSRPVIFAVIAVVAVSCSSDTTRFAENPFSSKKSPSSGEVTGSVAKSSGVHSRPLPPPNTATMLPPPTRPPVSSTAGGGHGMAVYQPGSGYDTTGSTQAPRQAAQQTVVRAGWTWEGGTPITVARGDTADTLAHRYGVPAAAIVQTNNLPNAAAIKPGQRLVIPRYEVTGSAVPRPASNAPARPAPVIAAPATTGPFVHTVAPGETLMKISRQYNKPLTQIARANNIAPHTMVKLGDRIIIPGLYARAPTPVAADAQQTWPPAPAKVASIAPINNARMITPAAPNPTAEKEKPDTTGAGSMPAFRWPVRGRVITGFGPKPSGQQNDGINVAVPEGTPIKAADDGVVAYAGNELKTYGNLVLVRHSNGFVTAYAHASEILVKRDEPIKRGQVIAKSGQTGNVSTPQLHFEIRKGSAPVDPMPYLDRGGST
jgi:murein DD-endopeptidase MepM/ murein hydrolase activator NlpD